MAPRTRGKGRKGPVDLDARRIPFKAKALCACSAVASIALVGASYQKVAAGDFESRPVDSILHCCPALLACAVSWCMMWRDEIEFHDGSAMSIFAILAAMGQTTLALGADLHAAGAAFLAAAHLVLAARNAKGLRVTWLKKSMPENKFHEIAGASVCAASILAALTLNHIKTVYGLPTAAFMTVLYLSAAASFVTATFACYSERFPKLNSSEMWRAVVVLGAAEAARGVQLVYAHSTQVAFGCLASTLFAAGLCLAGVAVYRRIILKSKTSLL